MPTLNELIKELPNLETSLRETLLVSKINKLAKRGLSPTEISRKLGYHRKTITDKIKKFKIEVKSGANKNITDVLAEIEKDLKAGKITFEEAVKKWKQL